MRSLLRIALALAGAAALLSWAAAQPPVGRPADEPKDKAKDYSNAPLVVRMMAFDKKKDGKLTKDEVTDERLQRLFDQADANKDGVVTKDELMALAAKLDTEAPARREGPDPRDRDNPPPPPRGDRDNPPPPRGDREPPPDGPGGPGGPPPGGPCGRFGPPRPGTIFPMFLRDALKLTDDQKKQLDDLQKDVDAKLDKILTDDQRKQLKEMRPPRGPGSPGGPGDGPPRGPGGPGDGPPPPPPGRDRDRPNPER